MHIVVCWGVVYVDQIMEKDDVKAIMVENNEGGRWGMEFTEDNVMVTEIYQDCQNEQKRACVCVCAVACTRGFMRKETEENKLFSRIITKGATTTTTTTTTTVSHLIALSIQCIPFFLHDFITFRINPIPIRLHEIYSHFAWYACVCADGWDAVDSIPPSLHSVWI